MKLDDAIRGRRSIRRFRKSKVPEADIRKIVEAGTLAPSACNRQQWEFVVVTDDKEKRRIYEEVGTQKTIMDAPVTIAVFYNSEINPEHHANVQSASAAVQNMLLKAHEMGYGTLWMCSFGDVKRLRKAFAMPDHMEPLCLVLLGKPDERPDMPPRKAIDDVLHFGKFGGRQTNLPSTIRSSRWTLDQLRENQRFSSRAKHPSEEREFYHPREIAKIKKIIKKNVPEGCSKVLTLFSYDGTALKKVSGAFSGMKITDCELTKEACEIVSRKLNDAGSRADFVVYDDKVPLPKSSIDMAVMLFSLEKMPAHRKVMGEVMRVLRPGGTLLVFFKNRSSPFGIVYNSVEKLMKMDISRFFLSPDPFEPVSVGKVKNVLKESGLEARVKPLLLMPHETLLYEKKIDSYLKRHGKGLKFRLAKPGLRTMKLLVNVSRGAKVPYISSSMYAVARKI